MHDWLGACSVEHQPVTRDDGQPDVVTILLPLTDQQLAIIEHRRAGADFQIQLNVDVTLGYHPLAKGIAGKDSWPVRAFQETIFVQRESWIRLLTQAPAGTSLAVVVPVPLDGGGADATWVRRAATDAGRSLGATRGAIGGHLLGREPAW